MRRRRNRPWRPRRAVAAWRLEAWKFLLMNLRPTASVLGQMEQAISLTGGGNRDHPYVSRDAQGESVLFNTGGEDVPGWELPDSDGAGDGAFRGGAGIDAGAGGGDAVEARQNAGASLLHLDGLLTVRLGKEDVLPLQAALLDHLDGVFQAPQFGSGVVRSEGELGARGFGHLDKCSTRNLVAVVDLDGHAVLDGRVDHLVH